MSKTKRNDSSWLSALLILTEANIPFLLHLLLLLDMTNEPSKHFRFVVDRMWGMNHFRDINMKIYLKHTDFSSFKIFFFVIWVKFVHRKSKQMNRLFGSSKGSTAAPKPTLTDTAATIDSRVETLNKQIASIDQGLPSSSSSSISLLRWNF